MRFEIESFAALKETLRKVCEKMDGVPESIMFDCKLVIDELVSNVLRHGGGRAYLKVEKTDLIKISVRGENLFRPPEKSTLSPADAERGRGLYLVDALVSSRTYSEEDGITVIIKTGG